MRFGSAQVVADLLTAYFTCCPAAVADDANCVWVTAPPICMAEAEQMIQQIDDTFAGTPFTLQIFTLKHAVADEAAGELANYFNKSWDWPVTCGETCRPKVIVLPEVRSNSLIVVAPTCCSEKVETVVLQCDEDSSRSAPACQHCPLAGAAIGAAAGCLTEEPCCPLSAGQRGLLLHQEQHRRLATECLENAVTSVPHCEASTEELIYTICIPVRFSSAQVVAETLSAYFTCCPAAEADSANCVWFTGSRICLDEAEQIVQQIDEAFASTPIQMQTFALHNKIADEVAKDLTACFNGCCHPLVLTLPEVRSNTLIVVMPSSCAEEVSNTIDRVDAGTLHVLRGISGTGWERSLTGVHYERVDGGITPRQETPEGYPEVAWPFGRPHAPAGVTPYYFDPGSPVAVTAASALTEQAVCQVMQTSFAVPARQCPGMLPPMAPVSFPSNARSTNNDQPTHITTDYMGGDIAPRSGYEEQTAPPSSCSAACNGAALGAIAGVCPAAECCHCQQSCPDVPLDAEAYKLHSARHFLEIGRQCEENGDYEMARNCYEEATRVCPGSKYAALANAKLAMATAVVASNRATHGGYETQEEPPASAVATSLIPSRVHEAYRMLQMGERFEQAGDLDNAYRCYQDAHAMCPACDDGRKALEHMMEIEAIRNRQSEPPQGGVEEQEPPANRHRPPYTSEEVDQREQARALYNMAEHALRCGELSTAYIQFQEAHLAFPDCYFGLRSIERMTQIETRAANGENRTNGVNTLGGQKVTPNIPR
ncbi:MAG TPA: hypothetical protein VE988_12315 [Gemmataceae bacterium]|nr:hypothetical protein [Gemmataceae bacterium]